MTRRLIAAGLLVCLSCCPLAARADGKALVGKAAPAADFRDYVTLQGEPAALDQLKGKVVLVNYWAIWCPHCKESLPTLRKVAGRYAEKGLTTVSLTRYYKLHQFDLGKGQVVRPKQPLTPKEEEASLQAYIKFHRLPHTCVVLDEKQGGDFSNRFAVSTLPYFMLIDKKGTVRLVLLGYGDKTEAELDRWIKFLLDE
ncbi:MAG: TlpA family protein disulfide reductase [Gemmataceae bacterium]